MAGVQPLKKMLTDRQFRNICRLLHNRKNPSRNCEGNTTSYNKCSTHFSKHKTKSSAKIYRTRICGNDRSHSLISEYLLFHIINKDSKRSDG